MAKVPSNTHALQFGDFEGSFMYLVFDIDILTDIETKYTPICKEAWSWQPLANMGTPSLGKNQASVQDGYNDALRGPSLCTI